MPSSRDTQTPEKLHRCHTVAEEWWPNLCMPSHVRLIDQGESSLRAARTSHAPCCVPECGTAPEVLLFAWDGTQLSACRKHAQTWLASRERRRASRLQPKHHLEA